MSNVIQVEESTIRKSYEKPEFNEIRLEGEEAVLGSCRTVAISCDTYHY